MKRDMDLVRLVLLNAEGEEPVDLSDFDQITVGYHCHLVMQAGLAEGVDMSVNEIQEPQARLLTLTWNGHDFLDAVRNETIWKRLKGTVKDKGGSLPFSVIQSLAIEIAKNVAGL